MSDKDNFTQSNQIIEVYSRIIYIEKQINNIENVVKTSDEEIKQLRESISDIKQNLCSKKLSEDIEKLKIKQEVIDMEMPELRLVKKLFMGMVSFILIAFIGLVWNHTIIAKNDQLVNDTIKKVIQEYSKNEPAK